MNMTQIATKDASDDAPRWHFAFRAIETNEPLHWNGTWLDRVLEMMQPRGFNALVCHQNDLLDELTHLDHHDATGVGDLRSKMVKSRVAWMRRLSSKLRGQSAELFLQVKEPSFADYIPQLFPKVVDADGNINPLHPVWADILKRKVSAVLDAIPELGGLIVSLSSPESRISPEDYARQHGAPDFDFSEWLERMIEAAHAPLLAAGKTLIVRDFTYGRERHDQTVAALNRNREGFAASIKISPRDYFPDFPNNAAAARLDKVPVVFEFEAFGENTGWGMVPNCRAREYCDRVDFVKAAKAHGVMTRINWEGVWGWSAIDCVSDVNIFALSELARHGHSADPVTIIETWLQSRYGLPKSAKRAQLAELLDESFECIRAIYWHGNIFPRHSQLPKSWDQGWWSMQDHALSDWVTDGSHDDDFSLTSENLDRLSAEKSKAVEIADRLCQNMGMLLADPSLPPKLVRELRAPFANLPIYIRAFDAATEGAFFAKRFTIDQLTSDKESALAAARQLREYASQFEGRVQDHSDLESEHVAAIMFDPDSLRSFAKSLETL